jgi:hypothetical protein
VNLSESPTPGTNLAPPPNAFRGFLQGKTRILLAWAFAILLGIYSELPLRPEGILLCWIGATVRYWASGYLRKDQRPAVGGPYAFVRNPLYLGTYLMAIGTAWAGGAMILALTLTVLYALVYHFIILDEEGKLEKIFGESYLLYKNSVPRFFPRIFPPLFPASANTLKQINPELSHHHFSRELARKNKAYEAYLSWAALIFWVALIANLKHMLEFID